MRAKTTLLFWPPDKLDTGLVASSPVTPNDPSCRRYSSTGFPGVQENEEAMLEALFWKPNISYISIYYPWMFWKLWELVSKSSHLESKLEFGR